MNVFAAKNHRLLFYGFWLFLGLMQSGLTELQDDEAYYWVFSKFPDWGYFDHPPMIALLVKMGAALLPGELGVRLFPLLLNLFSLLLIEKLTGKKNPFLFYGIALSLAVLQLGGFMAVPDTPLIFFTALFFLSYKYFLSRPSLFTTILLALSMALLFYTKYQALLVVGCTLLSNPVLFTKFRLYIAGMIALLLFSPHLYWQWQHHWVSFRYHLFESNIGPYQFSHTTAYLGGQLLLAGPLAGIILLPAALLYKPVNPVERGLKWTLAGIYLFFLLSSFRGEVEANWTSPALVPLIVLSHQYLSAKPGWSRWLFRLLPVTLLLVLLARIAMIEDFLPLAAVKKRFHAWKEWPAEMKKRTGGLPVVFSNSYQRASKYWFYSGQVTYSQNNVRDHRNNYNFWPVEDELLGKPVYLMDIYGLDRFSDSLQTPIGTIGYRYDPAFISFAKIEFIPRHRIYEVKENASFYLEGRTKMGENYRDYILGHPSVSAKIKLVIFRGKKIVREIPLPVSLPDITGKDFGMNIRPDLPPGNYYFRFSVETPGYNPTHNSEKTGLRIH